MRKKGSAKKEAHTGSFFRGPFFIDPILCPARFLYSQDFISRHSFSSMEISRPQSSLDA